jgi:hypothetical protein
MFKSKAIKQMFSLSIYMYTYKQRVIKIYSYQEERNLSMEYRVNLLRTKYFVNRLMRN